jgi:hypothetical protein
MLVKKFLCNETLHSKPAPCRPNDVTSYPSTNELHAKVQGTLTEEEGSVQLTSSLGWVVW